jgi:NAD(P)-dependent dehydrogenase (short-subunit alcohol dehydrogenase family)
LNNAIRRLAIAAGDRNTRANMIRVFGFCPGWVQTENQISRFSQETFDTAVRGQLVPLPMKPEDMVEPVVFLASAHARFFSGKIFDYSSSEATVSALNEGKSE